MNEKLSLFEAIEKVKKFQCGLAISSMSQEQELCQALGMIIDCAEQIAGEIEVSQESWRKYSEAPIGKPQYDGQAGGLCEHDERPKRSASELKRIAELLRGTPKKEADRE